MGRPVWLRSLGLCVTLCALAGCGAEDDGGDPGSYDTSGHGEDADAGGAEDAAAAGASGASGEGGSGGTGGKPRDDGTNCGAAAQAAERIYVETVVEVEVEVERPKPVAIYLLLDRSASMLGNDAVAMKSLWALAVDSVTTLVNDPASTDLDVALEYFPQSGHACDGAGSGYELPAVTLGRLPAHASSVTTSLANSSPYGLSTPIAGALSGGIEYCTQFQAANADEECVVVLVTDGDPDTNDACDDSIEHAASVAAAGLSNGVLTYAIGIGDAAIANLNMIATAGGTDCDPASADTACNAAASSTGLATALTAVRDTVVMLETRKEIQQVLQEIPRECEWGLPTPDEGVAFDKDRVNVRFTPSGDEKAITFGRVASAADCGDHDDAWYYDDLDDPRSIMVCDATCTRIKAESSGSVDVLINCPTILVVD